MQVDLALQEAKADVTRYWVDLKNKPEWFASQVNPAGKVRYIHVASSCHGVDSSRVNQVPALVYGSPKSDPENPSAESAKIAESLVILEFVADLYPDSGLLPKDPVKRARVRFFIESFSSNVFQLAGKLFRTGTDEEETIRAFIAAVADFQKLLPQHAQFAVGDHFTIADAAFAPFVGFWELCFRHDFGKFPAGTGPRLYQELFESDRFAPLQKYYANISSRESFKNIFKAVRLACMLVWWVLRLTDWFFWLGNYIGSDEESVRSRVNARFC
jgi:glutathione S-transferase